jgi:hypothetical protein
MKLLAVEALDKRVTACVNRLLQQCAYPFPL